MYNHPERTYYILINFLLFWINEFDQDSILTKLKRVKARAGLLRWPGKGDDGNESRSSQDKEKGKHDRIRNEAMKQTGEIHLIVVTLIAAITFTAGFTLPGG